MSIRKDLKEIKETLKDITKGALHKSKKYDEMSEQIKHIKLKVKSAKVVFLENGTFGVEVTYDIPTITVQYDKTVNTWAKNESFYAINKLNLVSFKDMLRVKKVLDEAVRKNVEGGKNE